MRTKPDHSWPAAVLLSMILAVPVLSHETPAVSDRAASVERVAPVDVDVAGSMGAWVVPSLWPSPDPSRRPPLRQGVAIPERTHEPSSHRTSRTISGIASWFCGGGSPCTAGHRGGLFAAAGPALRVGDWRGRKVRVAVSGRSVWVTLIDWCACPGRAIDLYADAFQRLAPLGRGVITVTVTW